MSTMALAVALAGCSAIVEKQLPKGTAELHRAAAHDQLARVKQLLKDRVGEPGPFGWTPLHFCAIYNAPAVANHLVTKRANVDVLDQTGMTPLHWASRKGNAQVAQILIRAKAEVMSRNKIDNTPLHEAQTIPVVKVLLAAGADMNARNIDGMTPMHTAANKSVAQFLIKKGGNINARAKDGRTPMDMPPMPVPRVK